MSTSAVRREQQLPLGVFLHPGLLLSAIPTGKVYRPVAVGPASAGGVVCSSGLQPGSKGAGRRLLCYLEVRFSVLGFRPWAPLIGGQCLSLSAGCQDHLLEQEQGASLDQQSAYRWVFIFLEFDNFPKFIIKILIILVLVSRHCLATQSISPGRWHFLLLCLFQVGV